MSHSHLVPNVAGPLMVMAAVGLAAVTPRAQHEATIQRATLPTRLPVQLVHNPESWRVWECRNKPRDCYHGGRLRFIIYTGGDWR